MLGAIIFKVLFSATSLTDAARFVIWEVLSSTVLPAALKLGTLFCANLRRSVGQVLDTGCGRFGARGRGLYETGEQVAVLERLSKTRSLRDRPRRSWLERCVGADETCAWIRTHNFEHHVTFQY